VRAGPLLGHGKRLPTGHLPLNRPSSTRNRPLTDVVVMRANISGASGESVIRDDGRDPGGMYPARCAAMTASYVSPDGNQVRRDRATGSGTTTRSRPRPITLSPARAYVATMTDTSVTACAVDDGRLSVERAGWSRSVARRPVTIKSPDHVGGLQRRRMCRPRLVALMPMRTKHFD